MSFNCRLFAQQLAEQGGKALRPDMLAPRVRPWRNRPYPPLLNHWRIEQIKYHLQNTYGKDPEAFGLSQSQPKPALIVEPKFNAIHWARKAARREYVQKQLANMDDIIAEWRTKRKAERDALKAKTKI